MKIYEVKALWFDMDNESSTPYTTELYEVEAEDSEGAWKKAYDKMCQYQNI